MMDPVRQIADAVLYEGYILWPYRRSALKNRQRWTFGGVYPRGHSEGRDDDPWAMRTECLLQADDDVRVEVQVRFLQVVERRISEVAADGARFVDELEVGASRYLAWEEARERDVVAADLGKRRLLEGCRTSIDIPAGEEREDLRDSRGALAGRIVRTWQGLSGAVHVGATALRRGLLRLRVSVENETPWRGGERSDAVKRSLCSTHTILQVAGGSFVSLTDPPPSLRAEATRCRNEGTWPVLVGEPGDTHTVLSSPIILEDHPRIAPESPGDLFDGSEIDQLLTLGILSLTDQEKDEMRDSDPRAREILERTEGLSEEELMKLHGTVRELGMRRR
jgi:hydrogenase maturation protease